MHVCEKFQNGATDREITPSSLLRLLALKHPLKLCPSGWSGFVRHTSLIMFCGTSVIPGVFSTMPYLSVLLWQTAQPSLIPGGQLNHSTLTVAISTSKQSVCPCQSELASPSPHAETRHDFNHIHNTLFSEELKKTNKRKCNSSTFRDTDFICITD